jgi:hypothetical protein
VPSDYQDPVEVDPQFVGQRTRWKSELLTAEVPSSLAVAN